MGSFQHADDAKIATISHARNHSWAHEEMERRIKICTDIAGSTHVTNRHHGAGTFPENRALPPLTDWPRHPYWQVTLSL